MKPFPFEYACPGSVAEAVGLLAEHGSDAAVLAGGQSLVPLLNLRMSRPSIVIDINRIPELAGIHHRRDHLFIGACARHNDVLRSPEVSEMAPLLPLALSHVAHEAIRNRGTLGGSLALAEPSAELPACVVCLEAMIVAVSTRGERRIAADEFLEDIYTTTLEPDELILGVEFPILGKGWRFAFDEIARRHGDFALAGLAIALQVEGERIKECRIVYSGVESSPRRITAAETCLVGKGLSDSDAALQAQAALDLEPMETGEYPPSYRLHLARILLRRILTRIGG